MTSKQASLQQEKEIAKLLGGRVQAGSGGTKFGGGDVHTDNFLIEAKTSTTTKNSFSVKRSVLGKMRLQAHEQRKPFSALAFRFGPNEPDFYIIDQNLMKRVVEQLDKE